MGVVSQDGPPNTGHLVGHRHGGFILAAFGHYAIDPLAQFILFVTRMIDYRACPMDEESTKITVSPFADTKMNVLATRAVLAWN